MKRILAGPHAVTEALKSKTGAVEAVYISDSLRPGSVRQIEDLANEARVEWKYLPKTAIDSLAPDLNHQGVIAITGQYSYLDLDTLLAYASKNDRPVLTVLDQIQDPRNLGAILRSVHAFGGHGVILTKDRAAAITAAAVRTSAGASELVNVARVNNLARALDRLKDEGYRVYGAEMQGSVPLGDLDLSDPIAIVLGNEGKGLRRLTAERCDGLFHIPMATDFDSLNVSAAAAISLYAAAEQRRTAP